MTLTQSKLSTRRSTLLLHRSQAVKYVRLILSVGEEKDDLSGHHQGHVGSLYLQWIMPTEAKAPGRRKGKEYAAGQDNYD